MGWELRMLIHEIDRASAELQPALRCTLGLIGDSIDVRDLDPHKTRLAALRDPAGTHWVQDRGKTGRAIGPFQYGDAVIVANVLNEVTERMAGLNLFGDTYAVTEGGAGEPAPPEVGSGSRPLGRDQIAVMERSPQPFGDERHERVEHSQASGQTVGQRRQGETIPIIVQPVFDFFKV